MAFERILPQLWMAIPRDERNLLADRFGLTKTGVAEIRDLEVISDGYSYDDLLAITEEKMVAYVGSEESFPRLWELTVAKARHELNPPIQIFIPKVEAVEVSTPDPRDTEKKTKKTKHEKESI